MYSKWGLYVPCNSAGQDSWWSCSRCRSYADSV